MLVNSIITDSDMIILQSVEAYLKSLGTPMSNNPQEKLMVTQQARDYLYSDIVQRVPRVASYILGADLETDTVAQGLWISLSRHVMDPVFVNLLMQYLSRTNNPDENGVVGAFLSKIMSKYIEQNWKEPTKPKKGETTTEEVKNDMSAVEHINNAINYLLGDLASLIRTRCGNLTKVESLSIAACIAMNNKDSITEIINSDLPITAQLFDVLVDPSNLIKSALLLEKNGFTKLSTNQTAFVDSLKRWVYQKLNEISTQASYQFLVSTYGGIKPDVSKYLIQIKDCGTQFSNLLQVAKQLVNQ